jgi:hypothetical protein
VEEPVAVSYFSVRLAAFGLIIATVVIAAGLAELGLPVPFAVTLALLVVAICVGALERRLAREAPVVGSTILSLSGLSGMAAAIEALPQFDPWIVGDRPDRRCGPGVPAHAGRAGGVGSPPDGQPARLAVRGRLGGT